MTAMIRQQRQNRKERTARKKTLRPVQLEQYSQNGTTRMGQVEKKTELDCQERTTETGLLG
jgi:hypothetical protein